MEVNNNIVDKEVSSMVLQASDAKAAAKLANEAKDKTVRGYDLNEGIDYEKILAGYMNTGFQATSFAMAVDEINRMIECKLKEMPEEKKGGSCKTNCTIFLGYTSNMISSGMREYIRFLCQHKMIDCIVSTAGGIEEDFIKCLAPTVTGDFHLSGTQLRNEGINRIGNLLIPNDNYCLFEDWVTPILDKMVDEQNADSEVNWTPSKIINRLGKEINNEESVYYWCWKNDIPVYSPALTDGSLGDMLYFHSYKKNGLKVDILEDLRNLNNMPVRSCNTGVIILGGGLIKHHVLNANLMRNGADYSVFINTASEFDGSDAGASPDEAVSWGKIKREAKPVKIFSEATLVFPLLVAQTFAKNFPHTKKIANA